VRIFINSVQSAGEVYGDVYRFGSTLVSFHGLCGWARDTGISEMQ